jgi:hypothetical protein
VVQVVRWLQERDRLDAVEQRGAEALGALSDQTVKIESGDGVSVARKNRVIGPVHLEGRAETEGPQSIELVAVGRDGILESHLSQLVDRSRRQAVAAGLLARELFLLD